MSAAGGVIDCHAHVSPDAYLERLAFYAKEDEALAPTAEWYTKTFATQLPPTCSRFMFGDVTERVPEFVRAGVGVQLISPGSSLTYAKSARRREELVTAWNDAVHDQIAAAPEHFRVLAGLPLPDVEASLREIDRELGRPGHVGFGITSHFHGVGIDDSQWAPVFEKLDRVGSAVFVHPAGFRVAGLLDRSLNVDLGTQFDDTLTTVSLYTGMTTRYPGISWIVAHLGGTFPFVAERLDEHWERDHEHSALQLAPSKSLRNIYFECAGHGPRAIEYALGIYGADRLLFGTDFPMVMADEYDLLVRRSLEALGADEVRRAVAEANPRALLGIHT